PCGYNTYSDDPLIQIRNPGSYKSGTGRRCGAHRPNHRGPGEDGTGRQPPTRRTRPSWTADAISRPSGVSIRPVARPLAPEADGEAQSYKNRSSARNGRWNHGAWSRLVPTKPDPLPTVAH